MKKAYIFLLMPLIALLWSCSDDVVDGLSGTYDNINRYNFTSVNTLETDKLKKGLKYLNMKFADDNGNTLSLRVVSREWTLQAGSYTPMASVSDEPAAMQYVGFISKWNEAKGIFIEGSLEVSIVNDTYYISGLLTGGDGIRSVINYRGPIDFEIGVDDPEPSGYTISMNVSPVTITDYNTWQTTVVPGVSKYSITVTDPSGNDAAYFDAINTEGVGMDGLTGSYTIAGSPTEAWLMDNGWLVPDYGMAGGTYVVSPSGEKQYITTGKITISSVEGITGETLYNFSGDNLGFITLAGNNGTSSFNIRFASYLEKSGTELKDLSFNSEVLGREVKYSVLLPKSFDGVKKFPVVYLLHGASGGNNDWLDQGNIASYTGKVDTEMIIVTPQASFDGFDSFYTDNFAGKGMNYETFFFTEFMPAVDAMYCGDGRHGIGGLSMGGFGTLYYGLKYADKFVGMYACSPAVYIEGAPNLFEMIWIPGPSPITVEIGTEDFLYEMVKGFNEAMQNSPLLPSYTYIERAGAHDWPFWSACSPKIVNFFDTQFKK